MTIPRYDDVRFDPLRTDEEVLERASLLLGHALRRQLWLMFLDEDERQLPVLMPSYLPRRPRAEHRDNLGRLFGVLCEDADADSLIVAYERRGPAELTDADRAWLATVHTGCADAAIPLRALLLVHDGGVRWVALDDLL